jgi:hypothetical protein
MKGPLLPFSRGELVGFCDVCENEVISPRFQYADKSIEGVAVAATPDDDVVLIDVESLTEVTLQGWTHGISNFCHELLAVRSKLNDDSPTGYIDREGNFVIPPRYPFARDFDHLGATVELERGGSQHRINRQGEVFGSQFLQIGWFHPTGNLTGARVEWRHPGEVVINQHAEQITDDTYLCVWKENEGLIPVVFDESTVGWLNADGVELRRLAGGGIGNHFQGGLVPLKKHDGKWGFIDLNENWVVEPEFDVVDFVAPTRLMLGHYRNNDPDDLPVVYLADLSGARIGGVAGISISPFDEDGIACIYRPKATSEMYMSERNYIDLDGNILLSTWL